MNISYFKRCGSPHEGVMRWTAWQKVSKEVFMETMLWIENANKEYDIATYELLMADAENEHTIGATDELRMADGSA